MGKKWLNMTKYRLQNCVVFVILTYEVQANPLKNNHGGLYRRPLFESWYFW